MTCVLPPELLRLIVDELESPDHFRALRLVSSTFNAFATPRAFRTLHVSNRLNSGANLKNLLLATHIAPHVEELFYCDKWAEDGQDKMLIPDYDPANMSDRIAGKQLVEAFLMLYNLSSLSSLVMTFYPEFEESRMRHECSSHRTLQSALLTALSRQTTHLSLKLRAFSIHNLIAFHDPSGLYESTSFITLLSHLTALHITTLSDTNPLSGAVHGFPMAKFWGRSIYQAFLPPCQHNLTSLTLWSDQDIGGAIGGATFLGLFYPHLISLSIQHFDFIARHGRTLTRLEMRRCKLTKVLEEVDVGRDWADVWVRFSDELNHLHELIVEEEWMDEADELGADDRGQRVAYATVDEFGWLPSFPRQAREEQDAGALEKFYATVAARHLSVV
ncbi:hypothetical protein OF83DRAFT_1145355 [Amylostereum chailletii]|nr:hypothetical protein OF83DRAFT_1145355 [Amylostereum chailletii]